MNIRATEYLGVIVYNLVFLDIYSLRFYFNQFGNDGRNSTI